MSCSSDEMRNFFQEYAQFCDLIWTGRSKRDTSFYVDLARECEPPVLECGCGTGVLVADLALTGIPVTGIDKFSEMIDVASEKIARLRAGTRSLVRLVTADITKFQTDERFGLAVFSGNTFSLLSTSSEQNKALDNIWNLLKPSGNLLIVQLTPDQWVAQIQEGWIDGNTITDPDTGISFQLSSRSVFYEDEMKVASEYRMQIHRPGLKSDTREAIPIEKVISRDLLLNMLNENRYRVIEQWGEYDRSPYHDGDKRIIVLAEKVDNREQVSSQRAEV